MGSAPKTPPVESFSDEQLTLLKNLIACGPEVIDGLEYTVEHRRDFLTQVYERPPPTSEPVHDYITDAQMRFELFSEIRLIHMQHRNQELKDPEKKRLPPLSSTAVAIVMVAPLKTIQQFVDVLHTSKASGDEDTLQRSFENLCVVSTNALREYMPSEHLAKPSNEFELKTSTQSPPPTTHRKRTLSTSSAGSASQITHRNKRVKTPCAPNLPGRSTAFSVRHPSAVDHCMIRDNNLCVITRIREPEAVHIFPHTTGQEMVFQDMEIMLRVFWGNNRWEVWKALIQDRKTMESPRNLISLERQMHWWLDNAKFALKPLQVNENELTVQFHWLRDPCLKLRTLIATAEVFDQAGLLDYQSWGPQREICQDNCWPVETGQTYVIRSENPEKYPLPSFQLLELQWNLLRVAAIAGAANDSDDDRSSSEYEEDIEVWGSLSEVESQEETEER